MPSVVDAEETSEPAPRMGETEEEKEDVLGRKRRRPRRDASLDAVPAKRKRRKMGWRRRLRQRTPDVVVNPQAVQFMWACRCKEEEEEDCRPAALRLGVKAVVGPGRPWNHVLQANLEALRAGAVWKVDPRLARVAAAALQLPPFRPVLTRFILPLIHQDTVGRLREFLGLGESPAKEEPPAKTEPPPPMDPALQALALRSFELDHLCYVRRQPLPPVLYCNAFVWCTAHLIYKCKCWVYDQALNEVLWRPGKRSKWGPEADLPVLGWGVAPELLEVHMRPVAEACSRTAGLPYNVLARNRSIEFRAKRDVELAAELRFDRLQPAFSNRLLKVADSQLLLTDETPAAIAPNLGYKWWRLRLSSDVSSHWTLVVQNKVVPVSELISIALSALASGSVVHINLEYCTLAHQYNFGIYAVPGPGGRVWTDSALFVGPYRSAETQPKVLLDRDRSSDHSQSRYYSTKVRPSTSGYWVDGLNTVFKFVSDTRPIQVASWTPE